MHEVSDKPGARVSCSSRRAACAAGAASPADPAGSEGEFQWGGIAGTHWWINPRRNLAGIVMAQRQMAFWHPFSYEMKRAVYAACSPQTPYRES